MTTVTAACLKSDGSRGEVEFIVHDQDLFSGNPIKRRHGCDGLTAQVHEGVWHDHPDRSFFELKVPGFGLELVFQLEAYGILPLQHLDEPVANVVPGICIAGSRITQSGK